jgi:D-inositol-3-phosphate glycosyltransferase
MSARRRPPEPMTTVAPSPVGAPERARRPRLLLVTSLYPTPDLPEAGVFVARRVEALEQCGVEVRLVAPRSYRAGVVRRVLRLAAVTLRQRGPVDGVEGHVVFPTGAIAVAAARLRRRPSVLYAHGSDVREVAWRTPVHQLAARLTVHLAGRVVTNSEATAAAVRRLGADPVVVPPGVDTERFAPGDRRAARRELGLPRDRLVALFVGGLIPIKGADLFAAALDGADRWIGVMVGRGALGETLLKQHPGIRLVGAMPPDDVARWMQAADVVVVPSRAEGLSLAAVEALACGTPVIAAAVGGLPEVVRDGVNGRLVPPGDPNAIRAALVALEDPDLRRRLAADAPASVAHHGMANVTLAMAKVWAALGVDLPAAPAGAGPMPRA